ncbi:MAG: metallophosphoesterase [Methanomicrobiales archaeon]|jgi:hypothetical protein|nr:metallophosphoesterase [Methanomicrobiales archaeon]
MKDVLLLADLHGQYGKMDSFLELNPDAIFIAGDITNMGPVDEVAPLLGRIELPCFAVPGNCDPREILPVLEQSDCVSLHGSRITFGPFTLAGIGGSNPTPFNTPFEMTDKQIDDILHTIIKGMEHSVHNVLISHVPPLDTLDFIGGNHVGSASIRRHMKIFDLVCCAHIHEAKGIMDVEGTKVVNPGTAATGECALIHFGDDPKDIRVEFLTV